MKVTYISESLASKKNGGSSLSGSDFLSFLRLNYDKVEIYTYTPKVHLPDEFYGKSLNKAESFLTNRMSPKLKFDFRAVLKFIYINILNFFSSKIISNNPIVYVNSWSEIFSNSLISSNSPNQYKVCVVRGNPESFIYQSIASTPDESVSKAADYLELFDALIFVSSIGKDSWTSLRPTLKQKNLYYLPNSIDDLNAKSVIRKLNRPEKIDKNNVFNIVVVGSVQTRKAQDLLLGILPLLDKKINQIEIQIIGNVSSRWGGEEIVKQIKESKYSHSIKLLGHRNDVFELVRKAHVALFLSRAEAFPRTVLEYMALEMPIIASAVSGVPEMIKDNQNGFLFDNDNLQLAAEKILWCYSNYEEANQMGRKARIDYLREFSKESHIEKATLIIKDINKNSHH